MVELGDGIVIDDPSQPRLSEDNELVVVCDEKGVKGLGFMNPVHSGWILDSVSSFKPLLPPSEGHKTQNKPRGQKRKAR